jgi:hypothetical protein
LPIVKTGLKSSSAWKIITSSPECGASLLADEGGPGPGRISPDDFGRRSFESRMIERAVTPCHIPT